MRIKDFTNALGVEFFVGVPDSQLKALCDWLMVTYGIDPHHHLIAANEGNAVGIAAGYHLATGKVPAVYMQNSGIGNALNPIASLMNEKVYGIPCLFIIGWRGEPGVPDEPQHVFQGEITLPLLKELDVLTFVLGKETQVDELWAVMDGFAEALREGRQAAFVVKKGALSFGEEPNYSNSFVLTREQAIREIVAVSGEDLIVVTTGKASRELFELREELGQGHNRDFLTVGSMGHASSIALGIAVNQPERKVWCIDGDGSVLMHMGGLAVIGSSALDNLVHVVINNMAHESVGGMPTVSGGLDLVEIARACGYAWFAKASTAPELRRLLLKAQEQNRLCFIEAACAIGARGNLCRPTITPKSNKEQFMDCL